MSEGIFQYVGRPQYTTVYLKIPTPLWNRFEARHRHFGAAIHDLRETVTQLLAFGAISYQRESTYEDRGDPFYTVEEHAIGE